MTPDYLSAQEAQAITSIAANPVAVMAIKKLLLAPVYNQGVLPQDGAAITEPSRNFALVLAFRPDIPNEQLGADLRASAIAINLIISGIREIEALKPKPEVDTNSGNPAR